MKLDKLLGIKKSPLPKIYGNLRNTPAILESDEVLTFKMHNIMSKFFSFDISRVGQASKLWEDIMHYINSTRGIKLVVRVIYNNKYLPQNGTIRVSLSNVSPECNDLDVSTSVSFPIKDLVDEMEPDSYLGVLPSALENALLKLEKRLEKEKA